MLFMKRKINFLHKVSTACNVLSKLFVSNQLKSNNLLFMDDLRIPKTVVLKHGNQYSVINTNTKNI